MAELQPVGFLTFGPNLSLNRLSVIVIIGEGRVNVAQCELLEIRDNLLRRPSLEFMPDVNILDSDASSGNAGAPAADLRIGFDMLNISVHTPILLQGLFLRQTEFTCAGMAITGRVSGTRAPGQKCVYI